MFALEAATTISVMVPVGPQLRLHTATLKVEGAGFNVLAFHACYAASRSELIQRLALRVPSRHLAEVVVREGVDVDDPIVVRLVPAETRARLSSIEDCSASRPLAGGGDLYIAEFGSSELSCDDDQPPFGTPRFR